jgi:aldose 1-epimerase
MVHSGCSDKTTPSQDNSATLNGSDVTSSDIPTRDPFTPITQKNASGLTATWLPYGAHLQSVTLPDGTNVLAQHPEPRAYKGGPAYVGSLIGRVGNRVKNGTFTIDEQTHIVTTTENGHALHSGPDGVNAQVWDVSREGEELVFRHTSPAGHQGYPGNLDVTIRTTVSDREVTVKFIAITDAPTPVNLSQHGYWNPTGLFDRPIDTLQLSSPADRFTAVDEALIPTGLTPPVARTPFDYRRARPIGTTGWCGSWSGFRPEQFHHCGGRWQLCAFRWPCP